MKRFLLAAACVLAVLVPTASVHAAPTCDVRISAPANLNDRLRSIGGGKTVCLGTDTFRISSTVKPMSGQTIVGGRITTGGGVDNGVSMRDSRARGVTIIGTEVFGFTKRGIVCYFGTVARDVDLHHNRQNGFGCHMDHENYATKLLNSHLWANGSPSLEGWGAGSIKFTETGDPGDAPGTAFLIQGNLIENGYGNGVWADDQSAGGSVLDNTIRNHTRHEIRMEVSAGHFLIAGNHIRDSRTGHFYGIDATSTARATIRNNDVATGADEIVVRLEERASTVGYRILSILIADNRAAVVRGCSLTNVACR